MNLAASEHQNEFDSRSEEHTSELQSLTNLVCRLLLEKKKKKKTEDGRDLTGEQACRSRSQTHYARMLYTAHRKPCQDPLRRSIALEPVSTIHSDVTH